VLNILLVDDEDMVIDVLRQLLVRLGHQVETAPGGHEGIAKFDSEPYDLVITDIVMSEIDGHGVAQHIRTSNRPATPIIGISGTPWLLHDDSFNSVIPKPFTVGALQNAIDLALGHPTGPEGLQHYPAMSMA
jgi:CheY-like chemotaxis protein